jgi:hydroxyacylglutathione hydrolase
VGGYLGASSALAKPTLEPVAPGVWVMRGGASPSAIALGMSRGKLPRRIHNVYLLEDEGGVTMFDAGIEWMARFLGDVTERMGGLKRIVLGHAHGDHRGAAPGLAAPVLCHPDAVDEAEKPMHPPYVDFEKIEDPLARRLLPRLMDDWDGGPVSIEGTVSEGDDIAGFEVRNFSGHAPGLIGLWREQDRLALVSDTVYTFDLHLNFTDPVVAHPFYTMDREQAARSVHALADLQPAEVWAGHADPVTGDVEAKLRRAADAALAGTG